MSTLSLVILVRMIVSSLGLLGFVNLSEKVEKLLSCGVWVFSDRKILIVHDDFVCLCCVEEMVDFGGKSFCIVHIISSYNLGTDACSCYKDDVGLEGE